jgi:tetratricopeptide (TPR) repeat protein
VIWIVGCERVNQRRARRIANQAVGLIKDSQFSSARSLLLESLALNPNDAHARYLLGRVYEEQRQLPEAIQEYNRAIYLKPDYYQPHFSLGGIYYRTKEYSKAAEHYEKVIAQKPDHLFGIYHLGLSLHQTRSYQRSEEMLRKVISIKSQFVDAYNALAMLFFDRAEEAQLQSGVAQADPLYRNAIDILEQVQRLGIANSQSHNSLGLIYQKQKQFQLAVQSFRTAMKEIPIAAFNLGTTYDLWLEELLNQLKTMEDGPQKDNVMAEVGQRRDQAIDAFKEYLQLSQGDPAMREQVRIKINKLQLMKEKEIADKLEAQKKKTSPKHRGKRKPPRRR